MKIVGCQSRQGENLLERECEANKEKEKRKKKEKETFLLRMQKIQNNSTTTKLISRFVINKEKRKIHLKKRTKGKKEKKKQKKRGNENKKIKMFFHVF